MKKLFKLLTAVSVGIIMMMSFAACGGSEDVEEAPPEETAAAGGAEETMIPEGTDFSSPDIEIEFGDYEGINKLASDMQSLDVVKEGTVIKITGIFANRAGSLGIDQEKSDTERVGLALNVEGAGDDYEYPADGTKTEVTGVAVSGEYYTEFRVPAENIKILE